MSEYGKPTGKTGNGMKLQMDETHYRCLTYFKPIPTSNKAHNFPQIMLPAGDKGLKYMSLWDAFLIQATTF